MLSVSHHIWKLRLGLPLIFVELTVYLQNQCYIDCWYLWLISLSPLVDNNQAVMIVRRIKGNIIRTILCCIVYDSCVQTYRQFLKLTVGLGLGFFYT